MTALPGTAASASGEDDQNITIMFQIPAHCGSDTILRL